MASPTVERLVLRGLLALPRPILRGLAGGGVVYKGGRTLDPRFQFLASQARRLQPLESLSPPEARLAASRGFAPVLGRPERGVRIEALTIETGEASIPARAYRPEDPDPDAPLMVYGHFGGGVIGDLDVCEPFCTILAKLARCPVLSVGYRLAPEHRFPAGLEDMLAAYRWGRQHAARFGAPEGWAAIGGDSIGGNFAAVIAQEMKRTGEPQPALQLLVYPAVDMASETPSMVTYASSFPLTRETMRWFLGHYMGPANSPSDPRLSPLRAADVSGLAPAVIATAGFDPLLDQGEAYARRLRDAGVAVTYRCYDHLAHGFTAFTGAAPAADAACREIAGLARQASESPPGGAAPIDSQAAFP